ncbi:MAG: septal ring lytic transglycosylase RlpA family protein [Cyanobacteriota bacterium]|nr:septal ring lytic transglycosylase RlpA family protein [Cyanobacteriota bacterium]
MSHTQFNRIARSVLATSLGAGFVTTIASIGTPAIAQTVPVPQTIASDRPTPSPEIPQGEIAAATTSLTRVYSHSWRNKPAATLYIRSIPVLTFLNSQSAAKTTSSSTDSTEAALTPVQRATDAANRFNALNGEDLDASALTVGWNSDREAYLITLNDEELAAIDETTILPDTTRDLTQDALQATNRLRRLLGNARPLQTNEIALRPEPIVPEQAVDNVIRTQRGIASWYGPGFHGRRSASGERFNQNAMTAAHRTLPFGTRVRVINRNNGRSVVVRINDRGPFIRGRVIDLSVGAARKIGMYGSGIAPVEVEVLGR